MFIFEIIFSFPSIIFASKEAINFIFGEDGFVPIGFIRCDISYGFTNSYDYCGYKEYCYHFLRSLPNAKMMNAVNNIVIVNDSHRGSICTSQRWKNIPTLKANTSKSGIMFSQMKAKNARILFFKFIVMLFI